ncbi:uncharacterized protein L969DRAFT_89540 [Mixia osmundae IAM 14324]|uniref:SGNH hydrolase-type esterase domain-containing protein n=1 Tax=Mixia osmundae (strain CBS 9802 / IAM 14324 / JCM 22182 / KY 12970) TaxID=764103 RepID=G7EA27_MIXOS|nr:uncharacterized protein L969DRAFT_89540 [Mixia osmundae IAM 14324]KEI37587.1 hypothetical protein L969DRAFT_89540 [Mixia osmundae IAM 14324]GAA99687.1 hypothetical protein E5Q_06390 [Mixia osmundae IAM 14324]
MTGYFASQTTAHSRTQSSMGAPRISYEDITLASPSSTAVGSPDEEKYPGATAADYADVEHHKLALQHRLVRLARGLRHERSFKRRPVVWLVALATMAFIIGAASTSHASRRAFTQALTDRTRQAIVRAGLNTPGYTTDESRQSCDLCSDDGNDELCTKYGTNNLRAALNYEGTSTRIRRMLARAEAGQAVKIVFLGGSVTAGHNADGPENVYTARFERWWRKTYANRNTQIINAAVPATSSAFFSHCFQAVAPVDADLYVIDLGVNDPARLLDYTQTHSENLYRTLLSLPHEPAVLTLSLLALSFETIASGAGLHLPISVYHDVPVVAPRNILLPAINRKPDEMVDHFFRSPVSGKTDLRHLNSRGHKVASDLLRVYFTRQSCFLRKGSETIRGTGFWSTEDYWSQVPRLKLVSQWDNYRVDKPVLSTCKLLTARYPDSVLLPHSLDGFYAWESSPEKKYFIADEPGSTISLPFTTGAQGNVYLNIFRSATYDLGRVQCWVDGHRAHSRTLYGTWDAVTNSTASEVVYQTEDMVPPGDHLLNCELLRPTVQHPGSHFRISGIVTS